MDSDATLKTVIKISKKTHISVTITPKLFRTTARYSSVGRAGCGNDITKI